MSASASHVPAGHSSKPQTTMSANAMRMYVKMAQAMPQGSRMNQRTSRPRCPKPKAIATGASTWCIAAVRATTGAGGPRRDGRAHRCGLGERRRRLQHYTCVSAMPELTQWWRWDELPGTLPRREDERAKWWSAVRVRRCSAPCSRPASIMTPMPTPMTARSTTMTATGAAAMAGDGDRVEGRTGSRPGSRACGRLAADAHRTLTHTVRLPGGQGTQGGPHGRARGGDSEAVGDRVGSRSGGSGQRGCDRRRVGRCPSDMATVRPFSCLDLFRFNNMCAARRDATRPGPAHGTG